jgi:hypothetical protein
MCRFSGLEIKSFPGIDFPAGWLFGVNTETFAGYVWHFAGYLSYLAAQL